MEKFSLTGGFKKLKSDLSKMTFKQKLAHLWTYYKVWLFVGILIAAGLSLVVTMVVNKSTTTLCSGLLVNVSLSDEAHAYLQEDLFEQLTTGSRFEKVNLTNAYIGKGTGAETVDQNYYTMVSITGLAVTGELDYLIMDKYAMDYLVVQEIFIDLRDIFTQDELDALGNAVVTARNQEVPESESIPVAINITELPFIAENTQLAESDTVFLSFTKGSSRESLRKELWQWINNWS